MCDVLQGRIMRVAYGVGHESIDIDVLLLLPHLLRLSAPAPAAAPRNCNATHTKQHLR